MYDTVTRTYEERYGSAPPAVVRAPGRVNLIGEHTDYNDGFVLPIAIDRAIWIALTPRDDSTVRVYSIDFDQEITFDLDHLENTNDGPAEYIKGVAAALQREGYSLRGWQGVVGGDVPVGAGLSSSAAIELAAARAFAVASGFAWDPVKMALAGRWAENKWVGVNTGIMDQMISAAGRADRALLIDCRSLETELLPLPPETAVVVMDTATRRGLVDSAYNERSAQCEAAAQFFGAPALRDVTTAQIEAAVGSLDPVVLRRARHIVTENERVLRSKDAMLNGDAASFGQLMNASHDSLRDDFEVSSSELDTMVNIARGEDGCYGARMTGAGFGGCAVALVREDAAEGFAERVTAQYQQQTGLEPALYICKATDGAAVVEQR
jgi:galactokinase